MSLVACQPHRQTGFTLLEVMLVLFIMGLVAGTIVFNYAGLNQADELKQQTQRFEVVFNMASDYAVLNQQTLGLRVEPKEHEYYFLWLDDEQNWQVLEQDDTFAEHQLPEDFSLELQLDDLPWDNSESFFDNKLFDEKLSVADDGVSIGKKDDEKRGKTPQVLIFSSGEITPFSMLFSFEPGFGSDEPVYYRVNGQDSVPLIREGPLNEP